jgi:dephospho-CoA kinase
MPFPIYTERVMIIGITGTNGAGKGTLVEYLKEKGFCSFSMGDFLLDEIEKRGLPKNRDSQILIGNLLRKEKGSSYIAETLYKMALKTNKNCVIESLRNPTEIEALRSKGNCIIWAVDADIKKRYQRISDYRGGFKDKVSFEKFKAQEKIELTSTDPSKQNLNKCIKMADHVFANNETKKELFRKVDVYFQQINNL